MGRYRVTLFIELDEGVLAAHDGDKRPPPNDIADWYGGDIEYALERDLIEIEHEPITVEYVGAG